MTMCHRGDSDYDYSVWNVYIISINKVFNKFQSKNKVKITNGKLFLS